MSSRRPIRSTRETVPSRVARRRELQRLFLRQFGRDCWLLGESENLRDLLAFLERAAKVSLPVLLLGPRGCGCSDAARWLHLLRASCPEKFVRFDLSVADRDDLAEELAAAMAEAAGGTLYLSEADEACPTVQSRLADLLNQGLARNARGAGPDATSVQLVASAHAARLHPALRGELAFLSFDIQPLAARPADVEALAVHFLRSYGSPQAVLSAESGAALAAYPWPGNIPELRQTMARVASFCDGEPLDLETLRAHAPQTVAVDAGASAVRLEEIVRDCARGDGRLETARRCHPALRRALSHLAGHLAEPLRLGTLAQAAFVSPSHLSHLCKRHFGTSPMALLTQVRVERAKQLLRSEPGARITEIAGRSGFGDLRHFERTFKRRTGVTPRAYRQGEGGNRAAAAVAARSAG